MKRIFAVIFAMMMGVGVLGVAMPEQAYALGSDVATCNHSLLGLRPWYRGLTAADCTIAPPTDEEIPQFVWTIVLNVLTDMFVVAGLLALGFIIWGGFKYIMSNGDPGLVSVAKKTIASAMIGLVISVMAAVISNTIINLLLAARGA